MEITLKLVRRSLMNKIKRAPRLFCQYYVLHRPFMGRMRAAWLSACMVWIVVAA